MTIHAHAYWYLNTLSPLWYFVILLQAPPFKPHVINGRSLFDNLSALWFSMYYSFWDNCEELSTFFLNLTLFITIANSYLLILPVCNFSYSKRNDHCFIFYCVVSQFNIYKNVDMSKLNRRTSQFVDCDEWRSEKQQ